MLFSDPVFLFLFLPLVILLFYIVPKKVKNYVLLIFSLLFYSFGEKKMVILLVMSSLVDFYAAVLIEKKYRKIGLFFSLIFNLSILVYYKYFNFFIENINLFSSIFNFQFQYKNIIMPLGISFFTFQTMSYTIDVYRGKLKATKNFIDFITYVTLFPQLVAGPIVRFQDVQKQLKDKILNINTFYEGVERFIIGLFKKVFIANNLATIVNIAFENEQGYGTLYSWLGVLAYTLNIYFDFSGYSDMAIGLGKIFGFTFPENFNYPYLATSIKDFWRRWHITMSLWFRDYVYISLGGNRVKKNIVFLNLLIVFIVTGLWHGASWNFIYWGLWHGVFLILERLNLIKFKGVFRHIYVLLVVSLGFVFFRANNINHIFFYFKNLFFYTPVLDKSIFSYSLTLETLAAFILAVFFSFPVYHKLNKNNPTQVVFKNMILIGLLIISYIYISIGAYSPFIYFKF